MAGSLNKVMIIGNLGRDPEVRRTGDGRAIANLNIATTENWRDKASGERREKTEWHRVVLFGGVADVAEKYLTKGSNVYIEGKLQTRKWQDQSGQDKYTTEIVVDQGGSMTMLGGRSGGSSNFDDSDFNQSSGSSSNKGGMKATNVSDDAPFDDDIPF